MWSGDSVRTAGLGLSAVARSFARERERWTLWSPVFIGIGIATYFSLDREPVIWLGPMLLGIACVVLIWGRYRQFLVLFAAAGALLALGFSAAQIRTLQTAAPVLERSYGPKTISGRVLKVEAFSNATRVTLDQVSLVGITPEDTPHRIRIRLRATDRPRIGSYIKVYGKLLPPSRPAAPGAFDFQRHAWYLKLGAVGFAFGGAERTENGNLTESDRAGLWIAKLRQRIATRIRVALPGNTGAVAAALVTGDRSAIPRDVMSAMRDSGLAHLLAISGLHMGLVAAILFFGLRLLLASNETLALRYPIKKFAALAALTGGLAYLILTGATIPTQRAFLMTGLVLLAVILDRTAISLRLVALAATVILMIAPESLLSASFQMSFAAVVSLVAVYESGRPFSGIGADKTRKRIALYVTGVAITTIVAGLATGIFAMYHFGRVAHFGLAANLFAVPITAFWIMPAAVLAMVLMPLGLEGFALAPMGWGIDAVVGIARYVAELPNAISLVPAMPMFGLGAAAIGGLWLCLWRRRWRYLGIMGVAFAIATVFVNSGPDILVSADGHLMAVRTGDGRLSMSTTRREKRTARTWLSRAGQGEAGNWLAEVTTLRCDSVACIYRPENNVVALVNDPRALAEDCLRADVVVSSVPVRGRCPAARLVVDRFDLWRWGSHAIWLEEGRPEVTTVADIQGDRPWSTKRRPSRKPINNGAKAQSAFLVP